MNTGIQEAVEQAAAKKNLLFDQLDSNPEGKTWCHRLSAIYDEVWQVLWQESQTQFGDFPPLTIIATGGYGRNETAPYSDIDVAFIPSAETAELDKAIRWLFKTAHDTFGKVLGVRLSYVYRPISDLPGLDSIGLTNLLDARHIAGSITPYQKLEHELWKSFPTSEFLHAKIQERNNEWAKTHETPLVTQPNLKLGAGGLRDFHCSNWIGKAIGADLIDPSEAVDYLLKIRNILHLATGKIQDELNFSRREELAKKLNLSYFELGSQVSENMSCNHEDFLRGMRRLTESTYILGEYAIAFNGEITIKPGAPTGTAAVMLADAKRIGLQLPATLPPLAERAGPEILDALTSGVDTLRALESTGIFSNILPELANCKYLMPHDAAHRYTVYEHTLRALKEFEEIPQTSPLFGIKQSLTDPITAAIAILFHDLGKADESAPHSETGAQIAQSIAKRFSFDHSLATNVEWLVREHLTMSQFIRVRDIDHPETIAEFAARVNDLERLKALTLLTYCDVKSVSPELWTPVQETYLLALFERTANVLENQFAEEQSEQVALDRVLSTAKASGVNQSKDIEEFLSAMPTHYLLSTPQETIFHHNDLFNSIERDTVIVEFLDRRDLNLTEITIAVHDRAGVLPDILGVLYAHNLSLQNIRCSTSESTPAVVIDTFLISKGGAPLPHHHRAQLENHLKSVLLGEMNRDELLRRRGKDPDRRQQFFTMEVLDRKPVILEIRAPRGRGLAYRLSKAINEQGLSILSARLGQWAGSASAGFYVEDPSGQDIDLEELRRNLQERINI